MDKGQVERKSGPAGTGEEAEARTIEKWLWTVDKPLATEKQDREDTEPKEKRGRANEQKLLIGGWLVK